MMRIIQILLLIFIAGISVKAQPYENLVFEGGGVRGVAYAGVIEQLDSMHILQNIKRVGGTSAGALAATAVALNYPPKEISKLMFLMDFSDFNDSGFPLIGGLRSTFKHYGFYKGKKLHSWIGQLIKTQTGNEDITFREMKAQGYRDLYITGTSLNQQMTVIFSHETFPNMKVKDAVLISMTIPLYFRAVIIDTTGQVLRRQLVQDLPKNEYHIMVDGGIAANLPIEMFDHKKYTNRCDTVVDNQRCINPYTLAVRLDTEEQIELDLAQEGRLANHHITSFTEFIKAFYTYSIEKLNRPNLVPLDWSRTILVSSGDISPRVKNLKDEEKQELIENGRNGVRLYFNMSKPN